MKNKPILLLALAALLLLAAALFVLWRMLARSSALPAIAPATNTTTLKIMIPHTGVYELTGSDLAAAGWGDVDPAQLRVFYGTTSSLCGCKGKARR